MFPPTRDKQNKEQMCKGGRTTSAIGGLMNMGMDIHGCARHMFAWVYGIELTFNVE